MIRSPIHSRIVRTFVQRPSRNFCLPRNTPKTFRRPYSSGFNYEKPGSTGPSTGKKGPSLVEGATILIGGIFIGWKTRVSYVKHKYGDPSVSSSVEEVEDEYIGLDWTEHPALPVLNLEEASKIMTASQRSYEFSPKNENGVRRLDTIRFGSNSPVEDQLAHESVNVGLGEDKKWDFWGVYDGHAGWATSKALKHSLISYVAQALKESPSDTSLIRTIKSAFLALDNEIMTAAQTAILPSTQLSPPEILSRLAPASSGSCALLAIHDPTTSVLHIANVGDSRAVLGRKNTGDSTSDSNEEWTAVPLSEDQTGFNPNEVKKIAAAHPGETSVIDPKTGRVLGLAISRAFGDARWKAPLDFLKLAQAHYWDHNPRPDYKSPPYLTAEPEVTSTPVKSGDFLILASDGLWDHISSEDAVRAVGLWVMAQRSPQAMRILSSLSSIDDAAAKKESGLPQDWKTKENWFTVSEGDNAAAHLTRQSLGGNKKQLFCSVVGIKAPVSRTVRDDITVQVVFFGDVVGE